MACYKHSDREGVAQCNDCGRFLCAECADSFTTPLCVGCATERAAAIKGELIKNIAISVVLMIIGIVVIKSPLGILLAGIPYGWAILNRMTPSMFLWMSWVGWLIYFFIKLLLAYVIGLIALPIKLIKWIVELVSINRTLEGMGVK
ncbi:MAG: hypothetical protein IJB36_06875 [Clostridia bacterium]|nr:hypothetical protein [Clostridia bacterium]